MPLDIQGSGPFVVDLDSLQHPDDVKKDNFGVWMHSGFHDQKLNPVLMLLEFLK